MKENNNFAIMYHYVRRQGGWKGINPLLPRQFEEQIDYISKTHEIISLDEIDVNKTNPWCVLTFDDGTKDQYRNAFDILKRKGIPAYFAVMSGPHLTGRVPLVHLVHTVLSFKSDEEIWELLNSRFDTDLVESESEIYHYEKNLLRRYNKYMLNFRLTAEEAYDFLEPIFAEIFPDQLNFIKKFYLSEEEIKTMAREGMIIGVHCHNHLPYEGNANFFYEKEIRPCKVMLEKIGIAPTWYTPAFGGGKFHHKMMDELTPILIQNGFKGAFTTMSGPINKENSFWFNRVDCNQIYLCKKQQRKIVI